MIRMTYLAALLFASGDSVVAQGDRSASVALTITGRLVSATDLAVNSTEVGPGAFKLVVTGITTGVPDAAPIERSYLVFEDGPKPFFNVAFVDNVIEVSDAKDAIVMDWPREPRDLRKALAMHKRKAKKR